MARKRFRPEQVISYLHQVEILVSQGKTAVEACRQFDFSEQTYYRWRKEYGGKEDDHLRRLKALELENSRLKHVVAEQALDIAILKEASRGN